MPRKGLFQPFAYAGWMIGAKSLLEGLRFACLSLVALIATTAPAQAETTTVETSVAILTPGTFLKIDDLHFGEVVPGSSGGTVVVAPDGTRTATGGVGLMGTIHHPAVFAGLKPGNNNRPVRIRVRDNTIQLTGPGAPMTVRLFNGNTSPGQYFTTTRRNFQVTPTVNGQFVLRVGATLDVNANQAGGTYTGNWELTLDYQ